MEKNLRQEIAEIQRDRNLKMKPLRLRYLGIPQVLRETEKQKAENESKLDAMQALALHSN